MGVLRVMLPPQEKSPLHLGSEAILMRRLQGVCSLSSYRQE